MAFAKSILVPAEEIVRISCLHDGNESLSKRLELAYEFLQFEATLASYKSQPINANCSSRRSPPPLPSSFYETFFQESNDTREMTSGRCRAHSVDVPHFYPTFAQVE